MGYICYTQVSPFPWVGCPKELGYMGSCCSFLLIVIISSNGCILAAYRFRKLLGPCFAVGVNFSVLTFPFGVFPWIEIISWRYGVEARPYCRGDEGSKVSSLYDLEAFFLAAMYEGVRERGGCGVADASHLPLKTRATWLLGPVTDKKAVSTLCKTHASKMRNM